MTDVSFLPRDTAAFRLSLPECVERHPLRQAVTLAVRAALDAVNPAVCIHRYVQLDGDCLVVGDLRLKLSDIGRIRAVGGGKAAVPMAVALHSILEDRIECGCFAVPAGCLTATMGKRENIPMPAPIEIHEAAHPYPDESCVRAASAVLEKAQGLCRDDLLIVLISGGASSMLTLPAPGLFLADVKAVTSMLLLSGADIESVNIVRKHLSAFSGGRLARAARPSKVAALILSDVVGDSIATIGSGPTAPDPSTYQDALMRLERFGVKDRAPRAIVSHLRDGEQGLIPETPKPDDPLFQAVFNMVIGGNRTAQDAAVVELIRHGIVAKAHPSPVIGEARTAGETIAAIIRQEKNRGPRGCASCMVFGGETTVSVQGSGKGGRNQELALAAAVALEGVPDVLVLTLATDGKDGPTDAAGAAVTGETLKRAQDLGLNATQHLGENNSHAFFNSLSDLLVTGPTETNAADLTFAFY